MEMQGIIEMMNEIQFALEGANLKFSIDLPRIAVVGAQSSGKSSVLEAIVGEDFLPRGTGIVTRCPLILQLINHKEEDTYAKFGHMPSDFITDFEQVRKEIEERTIELAGSEKKIVNKPIFLTIYSENVPNLTLIDLPGFTKLDLDDQKSGISQDIERLVMDYIVKENTIILAISPANNDIANSDGLLHAKKVDPNRERTFGVMTKIDIMDKGTNANDFIAGTKYKLKHGYIGVKCRSQDDNNKGKSIKDSLEEEKAFFEAHPDYKDIAHTQGISVLAKRLSGLLGEHITKHLPEIEKKIMENYIHCEKSLLSLGSCVECNTEQDAVPFISRIIDEYCLKYQKIVEGGHLVYKKGKELFEGGAVIYEIFQTYMKDKIGKIDPLKGLNEVDILTEIRKVNGIEPGLFVAKEACKNLIINNIERFRAPTLKCARIVHSVLEQDIDLIKLQDLRKRKRLRSFLIDNSEKILEKGLNKLIKHIHEIIDSESCYINYDDPDFRLVEPYLFSSKDPSIKKILQLKDTYQIRSSLFNQYSMERDIRHVVRAARKLRGYEYEEYKDENGNTSEREISAPPKKEEETETEEDEDDEFRIVDKRDFGNWKIKRRIDLADGISKYDMNNIIALKRVLECYIAILKKQFMSRIPKCVVKFLIKDSLKEMRGFLFTEFIKFDNKVDLSKEDEDVMNERDVTLKNMKSLKAAKRALRNVKKNAKY